MTYKSFGGVADGTRTHDNQNHNLGLYQLSYSHHRTAKYSGAPPQRDAAEAPASLATGSSLAWPVTCTL